MVKTSNIFVIGLPDGEERDNQIEVIFKEIYLLRIFQK